MRRILPLLLLAAILLGACTPTVTLLTNEPDASPTAESASGPLLSTPVVSVTRVPTPTRVPDLGIRPDALKGVEVAAWHGWDGSSASLFAQMAAEFTLSNKWGVKVKVIPQRNLSLLAAEVDKSLSASEHPDIVVALPEQLLGWKDALADLTPYVSQPDFGMSAKDFPPAFWEQSNINDKRYGVPAARSARFVFYNVSFAHDLGFDAAPQTPDEFRKQACAANGFWKQDKDLTNDGYGGLALDVSSSWQTPYSWLAVSGGQVFVDGEFHFNTPENIAALEYVSKLREDGCAWLSTSASNYEYLAARRALFITGNLNNIAEQKAAFATAASMDEWSVLPFPGQKPGIVAYGPDYAVLKSSPAQQLAAWLFIHWMLEPQNQARWARETGMFPVRTSSIDLLKSERSSNPQWSAALDLIPQAKTYPQTAQWGVASHIMADGFMAYFSSFPNATLKGVLGVMDKTVEELNK
jgi:ABC-type glycerol-3-phosphate transport system substrate-binding protein